MTIPCTKCGSENTREKEITSKKSGKKYDIIECLNGCKNDDNPEWNFSFFPPDKTSILETRVNDLEDRVKLLENTTTSATVTDAVGKTVEMFGGEVVEEPPF